MFRHVCRLSRLRGFYETILKEIVTIKELQESINSFYDQFQIPDKPTVTDKDILAITKWFADVREIAGGKST